jgi:hypothetical protein
MGKQRRVKVIGIRRAKPDLKRLSRAIVELAQAQAEADARAKQHRENDAPERRRGPQ